MNVDLVCGSMLQTWLPFQKSCASHADRAVAAMLLHLHHTWTSCSAPSTSDTFWSTIHCARTLLTHLGLFFLLPLCVLPPSTFPVLFAPTRASHVLDICYFLISSPHPPPILTPQPTKLQASSFFFLPLFFLGAGFGYPFSAFILLLRRFCWITLPRHA